jgi:hypothetical protein
MLFLHYENKTIISNYLKWFLISLVAYSLVPGDEFDFMFDDVPKR